MAHQIREIEEWWYTCRKVICLVLRFIIMMICTPLTSSSSIASSTLTNAKANVAPIHQNETWRKVCTMQFCFPEFPCLLDFKRFATKCSALNLRMREDVQTTYSIHKLHVLGHVEQVEKERHLHCQCTAWTQYYPQSNLQILTFLHSYPH